MTGIDYDRMQKVWRTQKRKLDAAFKRAVDAGPMRSPARAAVIEIIDQIIYETIEEWDAPGGAWPDDWSHFQRTRDDLVSWNEQIDINDVHAEIAVQKRRAAAEEAGRRERDREEAQAAREAAKAKAQVEFAQKYPEHIKLTALDGKNVVIGEFLDWLSEQRYVLARWDTARRIDDRLVPAGERTVDLIGKFFDIDPAALDAEKRRMLEELRD